VKVVGAPMHLVSFQSPQFSKKPADWAKAQPSSCGFQSDKGFEAGRIRHSRVRYAKRYCSKYVSFRD
jgi:hypothetical protein